ncbi:MAG: hypothetical protein K2N28_02500 [Muribaculaceae bacterium]|nr:hypothetical protein [Muribaculaceae bacterium]
MRNLIWITVLIISAIAVACTGKGKTGYVSPQPQTLAEDSVFEDSVIDIASIEMKGRVIEDTVIGHWTVKTTKDSNNVVVVVKHYWYKEDSPYWTVRDSSVFVTLLYDNKVVYSNKEIRTKDLTGTEGEFEMHTGGYIHWVSDSAIYLYFGCFIPDSDIGWDLLYQILPDGTSNIIDMYCDPAAEGNCVIAYFLAMYLNEMAAHSSAADMKRVFDLYCTNEITDQLCAGTLQVVPDDIDFRYANQTTNIDNLDGYKCPLENYSFKVKFKPDPNNKNRTDSVYMEVDGKSYKISKIDKVFPDTIIKEVLPLIPIDTEPDTTESATGLVPIAVDDAN